MTITFLNSNELQPGLDWNGTGLTLVQLCSDYVALGSAAEGSFQDEQSYPGVTWLVST